MRSGTLAAEILDSNSIAHSAKAKKRPRKTSAVRQKSVSDALVDDVAEFIALKKQIESEERHGKKASSIVDSQKDGPGSAVETDAGDDKRVVRN